MDPLKYDTREREGFCSMAGILTIRCFALGGLGFFHINLSTICWKLKFLDCGPLHVWLPPFSVYQSGRHSADRWRFYSTKHSKKKFQKSKIKRNSSHQEGTIFVHIAIRQRKNPKSSPFTIWNKDKETFIIQTLQKSWKPINKILQIHARRAMKLRCSF